jgi:hypothetical protein
VKTFRRRFIYILGIMAATFLWLPSAAAQEDVATIIRRSSEYRRLWR